MWFELSCRNCTLFGHCGLGGVLLSWWQQQTHRGNWLWHIFAFHLLRVLISLAVIYQYSHLQLWYGVWGYRACCCWGVCNWGIYAGEGWTTNERATAVCNRWVNNTLCWVAVIEADVGFESGCWGRCFVMCEFKVACETVNTGVLHWASLPCRAVVFPWLEVLWTLYGLCHFKGLS